MSEHDKPKKQKLVADAGAHFYHDKSGPPRETGAATEGKSNFSAITRSARLSVGLDPETGEPLDPPKGAA